MLQTCEGNKVFSCCQYHCNDQSISQKQSHLHKIILLFLAYITIFFIIRIWFSLGTKKKGCLIPQENFLIIKKRKFILSYFLFPNFLMIIQEAVGDTFLAQVTLYWPSAVSLKSPHSEKGQMLHPARWESGNPMTLILPHMFHDWPYSEPGMAISWGDILDPIFAWAKSCCRNDLTRKW